jgi:hypothetical protein
MLVPMVSMLRVPVAGVLVIEVVFMSQVLVTARLLDVNMGVFALVLGTGLGFHVAPPRQSRAAYSVPRGGA